jgi:deoxyinosine 3'endonuclease (endonuclease V)
VNGSTADPEALFIAVDVHYLDDGMARAAAVAVTAAGMTIAEAATVVREMAGRFRLPDALKLADRLARGLEAPGG